MRKSLFLLIAVLTVVLAACEPDDQDTRRIESVEYSVPDTTAPDSDGPAVDRTLPRERSNDPATMSSSERERFGAWDGTGDEPYGDDPDNDGRFSDVACGQSTGRPANGYSGGLACSYADGTHAVQGLEYRDGVWYWADAPISANGQCPREGDCDVVWSHALTVPMVVNVNP